MQEIKGNFNCAKVFTDDIDEKSIEQVRSLCNQEFSQGCKIRMMPDVHAGAGCTIGTTMTITDKICPNLVGVDIGCGMETIIFHAESDVSKNFSAEKLDSCIRKNIPSGFSIRKFPHKFVERIQWSSIRADYDKNRARLSLGTLGGGNHFIEADRDEDGNLYIVVHSGSRHAGLEVANYYQAEAWKQMNGNRRSDIDALIKKLKDEGREKDIESELKSLINQRLTDVPAELAYLQGDLFDDYINDMKIMQNFAMLNRQAMIDTICIGLRAAKDEIVDQFTTIHNYIETDPPCGPMILRKGAVSAKKGEKILIPINMRDGSLICLGKGNEDWNYSAPHGAGRIMGRKEAQKKLKLEDFEKSMEGIYSTCISSSTIDEAPMAYKSLDSILNNIGESAEVVKIIKPVFNFKASDEPQWKLKAKEKVK